MRMVNLAKDGFCYTFLVSGVSISDLWFLFFFIFSPEIGGLRPI